MNATQSEQVCENENIWRISPSREPFLSHDAAPPEMLVARIAMMHLQQPLGNLTLLKQQCKVFCRVYSFLVLTDLFVSKIINCDRNRREQVSEDAAGLAVGVKIQILEARKRRREIRR